MKKTYVCSHCQQEVNVDESFTAPTLICSSCWQEFAAPKTGANEPAPQIALPEKLPFFKSGRKQILRDKLQEVIADGELSDADDRLLGKTAELLGLNQDDVEEMEKDAFFREFDVIKKRMERTWYVSDEDAAEIDALKKKYGVKNLTLQGTADLFRAIYLLEVKGQMPQAMQTDLLLNANELAYYYLATTWQQIRVRNRGYSGASVSVPTGIKGVRFRFGGYTPIKTEEITPLANGTLYVTSQRLLFKGDSRSTTISLKKVIDGNIFTDALKVEKSTGKADYFSMNAGEARYILALIGALKQQMR
jgi:hypothetical protein